MTVKGVWVFFMVGSSSIFPECPTPEPLKSSKSFAWIPRADLVFLGMRRFVFVLSLIGCVGLYASQPIYYFPDVIRGLQQEWQVKKAGTPDAAIHFIGPFGLHVAAQARFGWETSACLDSAQAFHCAERLWLEYFCILGDSVHADLAMVYGPAYVTKLSEEDCERSCVQLANCKANPAKRFPNLAPWKKPLDEEPTLVSQEDLGQIPRYTTYTVVSGDSIWKIHQKLPQFSIRKLLEANGGKEMIYVGQVLEIPN